MCEIYWLSEDLVASQERPSSTVVVNRSFNSTMMALNSFRNICHLCFETWFLGELRQLQNVLEVTCGLMHSSLNIKPHRLYVIVILACSE